jgi:hypothetical protein
VSFRSRYFLELQPLRPAAFELLAAISVWADTTRSHQRLVMAFEELRIAMREVEDSLQDLMVDGLGEELLLTEKYEVPVHRIKLN